MTETELEYQFCFNCDDRKQCYTKPKDCTRIQEEIGLQDMTNEEYMRSCTTEQLAEWMALRLNPGILLALRMKYHCTDINAVREWLKEKHD